VTAKRAYSFPARRDMRAIMVQTATTRRGRIMEMGWTNGLKTESPYAGTRVNRATG